MAEPTAGQQKKKKVVVITGASAGVGRACAVAFARRGDSVALIARGDAGLRAASSDVSEVGGQPLVLAADIADATAVEQAAAHVEAEFGPIDVWVNNAMATVFAPVWDTDPDEFRRATEVTYLGFVWGTMAALRRMRPRDKGVIVQVGSALSYRGIPLQAVYCGAKFAIRGFTDSLRCELLHEGSSVRLTMIQLPAINTPQFSWGATRMTFAPRPVAPVYAPEIAARAVLAAADRPRRELWVGGRNVLAILAARTVPGALDHLLGRIGVDSQLRDTPPDRDRRENLFAAADDDIDFGATGEFGAESTTSAPQLALALRRPFPGAVNRAIGALLAPLVS